MKLNVVSRYKQITFLIEIIFGFVLLINGVILLINHIGLLSLPKKFLPFFSFEGFFQRSAQDWRSFIGFIETVITTHVAAFALITMGALMIMAGLNIKKSLSLPGGSSDSDQQ